MNQLSQSVAGHANRGGWSHSPAVRGLLLTALMVSLVLGGAFLLVNRLHSSPEDTLDHPSHPLSDDQAESQVVEQARQIVKIARLQRATAGYELMSCKSHHDPPYQGTVYLHFALPADARTDTYFRTVAAALTAHGWNEGLPPNQHLYGVTLHKDGVTAIIYPSTDEPHSGIMRLYGECRDMNDHRNDTTAWVDITDKFQPMR